MGTVVAMMFLWALTLTVFFSYKSQTCKCDVLFPSLPDPLAITPNGSNYCVDFCVV